jgi:hypothetical protein
MKRSRLTEEQIIAVREHEAGTKTGEYICKPSHNLAGKSVKPLGRSLKHVPFCPICGYIQFSSVMSSLTHTSVQGS